MWKKDRVGQGVLDEHAVGVARDQLGGGGLAVVGHQDGGFVVAKILNSELAEAPLGESHGLLIDARCLVLACWDVKVNDPPSRARKQSNLPEELSVPSPKGDERNAHVVKADKVDPLVRTPFPATACGAELWFRFPSAVLS